jgi:hypothetical protein
MSIQREIYVYPEESDSNLYLTGCRSIIEMNGSIVRDLPTSLFKLLKILRLQKDVVIINWFEDRMGYTSNQFSAFVKSLVLLILIRIIFRRVIWVRHNLKPHNKYSKILLKWLMFWLAKLSDCQVTHRPVNDLKSHYIPHPLYPVNKGDSQLLRDIPYLYFGMIKKYKGLDDLLMQWPVSLPLMMLGRCEDHELTSLLTGIIQERSLDVVWRNEFIDYDELSSIIGRTQTVVLPHTDNSMIVSGAFYHAISLGTNILIRDGAFYQDYLKRFNFVTSFNNGNLACVINNTHTILPSDIEKQVRLEFSNRAIFDAWDEVVNGS